MNLCPKCGKPHSSLRGCTPVRHLTADDLGLGDAALYETVAASLKGSYSSVTPEWVREVDQAIRENAPLPHGIVGMFIQRALLEARGERLGRDKDHES